jgi:ubiquitin-protein ligase
MRQVARIRLEKELLQIKRNHMNFDVHVSDDEELKWRVSFRGPEGSIYENERFS